MLVVSYGTACRPWLKEGHKLQEPRWETSEEYTRSTRRSRFDSDRIRWPSIQAMQRNIPCNTLYARSSSCPTRRIKKYTHRANGDKSKKTSPNDCENYLRTEPFLKYGPGPRKRGDAHRAYTSYRRSSRASSTSTAGRVCDHNTEIRSTPHKYS